MNLNRLIIDTLKPLGVPVSAATYNNTANTYIVFVEYNQASRMNVNDEEYITKHFFQVDVFSKGNYLDLVNQTRKKMKAAGFRRMFESETFDDDMKMFRKIMRFNYEHINEEEI